MHGLSYFTFCGKHAIELENSSMHDKNVEPKVASVCPQWNSISYQDGTESETVVLGIVKM